MKINLSIDVNNNACASTSMPLDSSVDISCKVDHVHQVRHLKHQVQKMMNHYQSPFHKFL